ncbi:MAG: response regulator [Eubacterium sp.]|nr:response regulator [Eubacterium sp.]
MNNKIMVSLEKHDREVFFYRISLSVVFAFLVNCILIEIGTEVPVNIGDAYFSVFHIIAILVVSFYGYFPAMVYILMMLIYAVANDFNQAYDVFQLLLAAAVSYAGVKRRVYSSVIKSFLMAVVLAFVLGNVWDLLLVLCGDLYVQGIGIYYVVISFAHVFPECIFCVILIYTFFNCVSDEVKIRTMTGFLYTKKYERMYAAGDRDKPFKLGRKIVIALVILTSAIVVFTIVFLRPSEIYSGNSEYGFFANEEYLKIVESEYRSAYGYAGDNHLGVIYFFFCVKRMLMLCSFTIPIIAISNYMISILTLEPVKKLSRYIDVYSHATEEQRYELRYEHKDELPSIKDEVYYLYASLYHLTEVVDRYGRQLKKDKRLKEELRTTQALNKARTGFLSRMSHEIRTPINTILGMNEMIIRETGDDKIKEYAVDIQNAGKTLVSLINDVLDFSKIEMGTMELSPVQYDIGICIADLINMISARAKSKNLEILTDINYDIPSLLFGDEIRIKQCCLNILNNAVKYTEEGFVKFTVDYEKIDENFIEVYVAISDSGIGIKEEELSKLYKPFERIDEVNNRNVEGTGLGMSIVKSILSLMDSHVDVESVYGQGSTFSFKIKQEVVSWNRRLSHENIRSTGNKERYVSSFHAPDAAILIVDDTVMNIEVIKGLISDTQIKIYTAESGMEALSIMTQHKFDIIFMDHRMPGMDGIETLNASTVMQGNLNKETPFVALTANVVSGAREMFLQNGFVEYMSKPVDSIKLEQTIINLLPEDKVIYRGEPGFEEVFYEEDYEEVNQDVLNLLYSIDPRFINVTEAVKNCGSEDMLVTVMKDFGATIDSKADIIEAAWKEKDIENYTIHVHALKSSARLIGALELSERAAHLEACGNNSDIREIMVKTHELLVIYRAYKSVLKDVMLFGTVSEENLEEIPEEDFIAALSDLSQAIEAYDFDTADSMIEMFGGFKIPDKFSEEYDKLLLSIKDVDRDRSLDIIKKILSV